jgi:cytochrome c-type biogenesis protein
MGFFALLQKTIESSSYIAFGASFVWGFISVLISPCHLASIPLIIGYIGGQSDLTLKKAFQISLIFSAGMFTSIAAIGIITASLGRIMGDLGVWGNYLVAIVFFLVGLNLMGIIPLNWNSISIKGSKNKGWLGSFILGFIFGIGLGPCTFAFMAPILGVVFTIAKTRLWFSILLILTFAIGHVLVIVLAGTFTESVQRYLKWSEKSKGSKAFRFICGFLVFLGGIYMILKARGIV